MRVCFFMHRFDSGGAEKMTVILANEMQKQGYQVSFCVRYDYGEIRYLLDPEIPVLDMKLPEKSRVVKNLKNILFLRKLLAGDHYDVMLSVTAEMSQVAAMATWLNPRRIPLIQVVHNTLSKETHSFQKIRNRLYPIVDKRMNGVVAVSEAVREDYIRLCGAEPGHVFTVYNPVVSEQVFQMAKEPAAHPWLTEERKWKTIVLAGRLSFQKNHRLMLCALELLSRHGDYRLILLGIGELEEELKKQAADMGLKEKVDFYGYVTNPYAFYAAADCVVLSSRFEGLPTILIEALACGSRIVSTDCPSGPREILEDGKYGILVPVEDAAALADGIERSLAEEPDREKLRKRSLDFSIEKSVERYGSVLDEIMRRIQKTGNC